MEMENEKLFINYNRFSFSQALCCSYVIAAQYVLYNIRCSFLYALHFILIYVCVTCYKVEYPVSRSDWMGNAGSEHLGSYQGSSSNRYLSRTSKHTKNPSVSLLYIFHILTASWGLGVSSTFTTGKLTQATQTKHYIT